MGVRILLRYDEIYSKLEQELNEEFGDITIEPNTNIHKIANALARTLYEKVEMQRAKTEIIDNDIYVVEGEAQDRLYSQDGRTKRKADSKSKGTWITRDSIPNTYVEANELKVSAGSDLNYTNVYAFVVDNAGYAEVQIICDVFGKKGNVEAGGINTIVTPIAGINTGTNEEPTIGGQDLETDAQYRARFLMIRGLVTGLTKDDIQKKVLEVGGVLSLNLQENEDEIDKILPINDATGNPIDLIMQKKSTAIWVRGGADTDIADAINLKRNVSIYQHGDVIVPTYSTIREIYEDVKFFRSFPKKIYYRIIVEGIVDLNKVKTIINEYLLNIRVGGKVTSGGIEKVLYKKVDVTKLENIEIEFSYTIDNFSNSLQLKADEHIETIEEVIA